MECAISVRSRDSCNKWTWVILGYWSFEFGILGYWPFELDILDTRTLSTPSLLVHEEIKKAWLLNTQQPILVHEPMARFRDIGTTWWDYLSYILLQPQLPGVSGCPDHGFIPPRYSALQKYMVWLVPQSGTKNHSGSSTIWTSHSYSIASLFYYEG